MESVRAVFRAEVLCPPRVIPTFFTGEFRIPSCPSTLNMGLLLLCRTHHHHWVAGGRPAVLDSWSVHADARLLQRNQVQALMYWSSALVGFEKMDPDLVILKDPAWATLPDYSLATSQPVIDKKPELVEGISRVVAMAMVFALANPDCARRLLWK